MKSMYMTGFFLAMVRMLDSFHRKIIKNYIKECFGWPIIKQEDEDYEAKPLNYFVTKSLNLELIYIILKSIGTFAKSTDKIFDDHLKSRDYKEAAYKELEKFHNLNWKCPADKFNFYRE